MNENTQGQDVTPEVVTPETPVVETPSTPEEQTAPGSSDPEVTPQ